ncbi:MAG: hypothetical protein IJC16_07385 [Rikenellaceae bacterium]|nr:hypothetical protein [Rikenellaceae bacterium]
MDEWLRNFDTQQREDNAVIRQFRLAKLTPDEVFLLIGKLTMLRVAHDSGVPELRTMANTYPLNQTQISEVALTLLKDHVKDNREISVWDFYNAANRLYKPGETDVPAIINQNMAMVEFLVGYFDERGRHLSPSPPCS